MHSGRIHAVGFSCKEDGALDHEMHSYTGWDEKHEITSEHYQADTCKWLEWHRLLLLVADTCIFRNGVHFLFVASQLRDRLGVVISSTSAYEGGTIYFGNTFGDKP